MKWLILMMLISCGKHEEPVKLDLGDSDGDQILNMNETGSNKYISEVEKLGSVKGILRFAQDAGMVDIILSNEIESNHSLKLMVTRKDKIKNEEYFNEWSRLKLASIPSFNSKGPQQKFQLRFETNSDIPDEVQFVKGQEITSLGKWSPVMDIILSSEDFKSLIAGHSYIAVRKKVTPSPLFDVDRLQTVKNKTSRVYFFDGKETSILYVSKEISFEDLLRHLDIREVSEVTEEELFFNGLRNNTKGWFKRNLPNGDKVLVKTGLTELREELFKRYTYQKTVIFRENGAPQNSIGLNNKKGAKVFLRFSNLNQVARAFGESTNVVTHSIVTGVRGRRRAVCEHYNRSVQEEKIILPGLDELLTNISNPAALLNALTVEQIGEKNLYWEMQLKDPQENIQLSFLARPESTYTVTGEYDNSCRKWISKYRLGASYSTNSEAKFSFEIETFVENVD